MKSLEISPKHIFTVLAVLILSIFFAWTLQYAYGRPDVSVTYFGEQGVGPALNAIYFTALMSLAGFFVYLLIKLGQTKFLKVFLAAIYSLMIFTLVTVYIPSWLWLAGFRGLYQNLFFLLAISAGVVAAVVYLIFFSKGKARTVVMGAVSSALGSILGFFIPTVSTVVILVSLSVYDIFAVWKGPIGKIAARREVDSLSTLMVSVGDVKIGLGDLVFYSMLTAHVFVFFNWFSSIAAISGVLLGVYLTLKMLRKRKMFPGLPLALGLGLALSIIVYYFTTQAAFL